MSSYDRNVENISGNIPRDNDGSRGAVFGSKGRFYFQKFLLIGLLILLLPVSSVAKNITCGRLPLLMGSFLSTHYAMKNMSGDIKIHAVDQMIKSLDPSKTLLYASDVEKLRPVLQNLFASMQSGDCVSGRGRTRLLSERFWFRTIVSMRPWSWTST